MTRSVLCAALHAAAIFVVVGVLAGCAPKTDWAGISQAMKERRP